MPMVASQMPSPSSSLKGLARRPSLERTGDVHTVYRNGFLRRHVHAERNLSWAHAGATRIETRSSQCRRVANQHHVFTGHFQHAVSEVVRTIFASKGFIGVGPAVAIDVLEDKRAIFKGIGVKDARFKRRLRWRLSWGFQQDPSPEVTCDVHTIGDTALYVMSTRKRTVVMPHAAQLP